MRTSFSKQIKPYIEAELNKAASARSASYYDEEFSHLERAHVLGQESTYWHVKVHVLMLAWAVRNHAIKEALGQVVRIVGAATVTVLGLIPLGNTGGSNVSPFKKMPIDPELAALIHKARDGI